MVPELNKMKRDELIQWVLSIPLDDWEALVFSKGVCFALWKYPYVADLGAHGLDVRFIVNRYPYETINSAEIQELYRRCMDNAVVYYNKICWVLQKEMEEEEVMHKERIQGLERRIEQERLGFATFTRRHEEKMKAANDWLAWLEKRREEVAT